MLDFLLKHAKENPTSFHMPGHKGAELFRRFGYQKFTSALVDCDITEINGADNLFQPETIIREIQEQYKGLYETQKTYLLVNGASVGIIASILSVVEPGGKIIMARNCHKAVFNALRLGNITPVYIYPEILEGCGLSGPVTASQIQQLLLKNLDAKAVVVTSPNYYGICSDIEEIAEVVHKFGKILIVDQAHGAHLKFLHERFPEGGVPKSAEDSGADIIINSTHKTLASFTQSAILNICSDKIPLDVIEDRLQMLETTSPSYLLMASLAVNAALLKKAGPELMQNWAENLNMFYDQSRVFENIKVIGVRPEILSLDRSKINIDVSDLKISPFELVRILENRYSIYPELVTGNIIMFMSGIGNVRKDYENLLLALHKIEKELEDEPNKRPVPKKELPPYPKEQKLLQPVPQNPKKVRLEDAEGRVCAASIVPYPPGYPVVCPGEVITSEVIAYVKALRENGENVLGISEDGMIQAGPLAEGKNARADILSRLSEIRNGNK